jgi:hypothetical protein
MPASYQLNGESRFASRRSGNESARRVRIAYGAVLTLAPLEHRLQLEDT